MELRVKEIIKEKGLSVNALAESLGVSRQALSAQINGTANISTLEKIATSLGVPLWQLFVSPADAAKSVTSGEAGFVLCPHCGKNITLRTAGTDAE